jgi:pyridoxal phosphate enzyme (YggS family)
MTVDAAGIAARWREVRARVDAACVKAGRAPAEVTVVAVSKFHPPEAIAAAVAAGVRDLGENYAQELAAKQAALATHIDFADGVPVAWHYIGRLQRNKARLVAGKVALIHAVDSAELAVELDRRAGALQPVLIAVNVAGEDSKGGVAPAAAAALVAAIDALPNLRCDGLMTMPPPVDDAEDARPHFAALRALRDSLATPARPLPFLSMGMSDDFEVAIAEGATHVRIGTSIFGPRPAP